MFFGIGIAVPVRIHRFQIPDHFQADAAEHIHRNGDQTDGGKPAQCGFPLKQQRPAPFARRGDRRSESGRTAAGHDDIIFADHGKFFRRLHNAVRFDNESSAHIFSSLFRVDGTNGFRGTVVHANTASDTFFGVDMRALQIHGNGFDRAEPAALVAGCAASVDDVLGFHVASLQNFRYCLL